MRSCIYFFKSDIRFRFFRSTQVSDWVKSIIRKEGKKCGELSIVFCSDDYLLDLNRRFLKHDYLTDVITFPSGEKFISGEIYISVDRVRENAAATGIGLQHELRRVIIHGVLHLLGYTDASKVQKTAMRLKEDACLSLLPSST